jgi:arylsulfatase A-like enzyme
MESISAWGYANPNGRTFQFQGKQDTLCVTNLNERAHTMRTILTDLALILLAISFTTVPFGTVHGASSKPNIVVILVDDMGFADLGCYGSEIPTPNLDKLAANGLRFTQFYNTARCCPTRASLLTGLYPHQTGVGHMTADNAVPGYRGRLNDRCVTIAEVLRQAGYFTAISGKWHVGQNHGVVPWERGFDRSLNAAAGGFYFPDSPMTELFLNGENVGRRGGKIPDQWYSTDLWTDFGVKFIDEALAAKKPFFLYLAHNAPHFPLQAPPEDIAKFRGKYQIGWDKLREQRRARQIEMGIVDMAWPLSPRPPEVKPWDSVGNEEKDRFDHIMAIYAAVVNHMDASVGRLVAELRQRGVLDNTLIFFMSDNGGNAESGPDGRLNGSPPGSAQSDVFCGQSWATLENTPFRRYKHFNHEGGIATPLIVHWPARIAGSGELRHQPGHLVDIMATCVDVAGAKYPAEFNGKPIQPMEGKSLVPAFSNQPIQREAIYWEHEGNGAIRVGDWKLVRLGRGGPWELYDLKADRTELHDLAAEKPDLVKQLAAKWDAWAERAHVKPYPAPTAKKAGKAKRKAKNL